MSGFTLRLKQTPSLRVDMRGVLPSADLRTMKVGYGNALVPLAARDLLLLAKPQFELQPGDIGKHGLVNDPVAHGHVKARMTAACVKRGLVLRDYFESTVAGGDGNREHFVWAQKP